MNNLCIIITNKLLNLGIVSEEKYEWCIYTIHKKLSLVISCIVIYIIGIISFNIYDTILITVILMNLRKRTGGYHAKNDMICYCLSISVIVLGVIIVEKVLYNNILLTLIIYCVSVIIIIMFSPVNHPNIHFDTNEYLANKKIVLKLMIFYTILIVISSILNLRIYFLITTALLIDAASVVIAKILKQEILAK